jgi:hypothetical protein
MMRIAVNGDLSRALHVLREGGEVSEAKQRQYFVPRSERRRLKAKRHRAQQLQPWTLMTRCSNVHPIGVNNPRIPTRTPIKLGAPCKGDHAGGLS